MQAKSWKGVPGEKRVLRTRIRNRGRGDWACSIHRCVAPRGWGGARGGERGERGVDLSTWRARALGSARRGSLSHSRRGVCEGGG